MEHLKCDSSAVVYPVFYGIRSCLCFKWCVKGFSFHKASGFYFIGMVCFPASTQYPKEFRIWNGCAYCLQDWELVWVLHSCPCLIPVTAISSELLGCTVNLWECLRLVSITALPRVCSSGIPALSTCNGQVSLGDGTLHFASFRDVQCKAQKFAPKETSLPLFIPVFLDCNKEAHFKNKAKQKTNKKTPLYLRKGTFWRVQISNDAYFLLLPRPTLLK